MRKKHDEGYALVFVLVVMVVLSLIAISLMTAALKNLRSQQETVARMEAKYQAQGEMEIKVAEITKKVADYAENDAKKEHNSELESTQKELSGILDEYDLHWPDTQQSRSCTIELTTIGETENGLKVQVDCTIELVDVIAEEKEGEHKFHVVTKPAEVKYVSYVVTYTAPSEPEEGGAQ